jgi:putative ABC transport system permease protein
LTPGIVVPTVEDWRARTSLFQALGAFGFTSMQVRVEGEISTWQMRLVTRDFFDVLGVPVTMPVNWRPALAGGDEAVLITEAGRARLPRQTSPLGLRVPTVSGPSLAIAGTLPPSFLFPDAGQVRDVAAIRPYDPGAVIETVLMRGRVRMTNRPTILARLQPGLSLEAVRSALAMPLAGGLRLNVQIERVTDRMTKQVRPAAFGAMAAGALILLVCAANVTNLLMARGAFRTAEVATRQALGATSLDLVRLRAFEMLLVTMASVGVGLLIAWGVLVLAAQSAPDEYVTLGAPGMSWRVAGAGATVGLGIVLFGLLPASLLGTRTRHIPAAARFSGSPAVRWLRFMFAAGQAAVAMVLVVGAGMVVQSYVNLVSQDIGYNADSIAIDVGATLRPGFNLELERSLEQLRRVQGVVNVAATNRLIRRGSSLTSVEVEGKAVTVDYRRVTPEFFEAAGIAVRYGRTLGAADEPGRQIVVNEALAARLWPGITAVGQVLTRGVDRHSTVVGVVQDTLDRALDEPPTPVFYTLYDPTRTEERLTYVVRTRDRAVPYSDLRRAVLTSWGEVEVTSIARLGDRVGDTVRDRSFATLMLGLFGVAGAAVTTAGLVGIVTFGVARRTREIAIRMAIGASARHVLGIVTRESLVAAVSGGVTGLLVGRWLSRWLEHLVFGITAGDWMTTALAGIALAGVMLSASHIAARRALHVPPTLALRAE